MEYAEHLGFWSILPVLLAIASAVVTRKVILALFLGVYGGVLSSTGAGSDHIDRRTR